MKRKVLLALAVAALLVAVNVLIVTAVSGAAFTTFNPWVDGLFKEVCKNSIINCNIYGAKEYVWLNGGPAANGLAPDGEYFFAVLVPGGQPDPKDGSPKNLSDDFDEWTNRTFTITDGEVSDYGGTHWLDSGDTINPNRSTCNKPKGCLPDNQPPLIRLFPYADTTNPGGVYILAICSLERGYDAVTPRDCKYDAFKVKGGTAELLLEGMKFEDLYADGFKDVDDPGLPDWWITIKGTGFLGEPIDEIVKTGAGGYWSFGKSYAYTNKTVLVNADLEVCEVPKDKWFQSYPTPVCYELDIAPSGMAYVGDLDFGNYRKVEVTGCKENYLTGKPIEGWLISLTQHDEAVPPNSTVIDTQPTGADGCYTWTDLMPGVAYDLHEAMKPGWKAMGPVEIYFPKAKSGDPVGKFAFTFENMPLQGCTPGFWQGGTDGGQAGGKWLWNEVMDPDWSMSGGYGWNPFVWDTPFSPFFYDPDGKLAGYTMFMLVDGGGGSYIYAKTGRALVAAYLNAAWGMGYAYSPAELMAMWKAAYGNEAKLEALHTELDLANNYYYNPEGMCPISASIQ